MHTKFNPNIVPSSSTKNVRGISHPDASTPDRFRLPECAEGPTFSLDHFILQCLNFSICIMRIILSVLLPHLTKFL